MLPSRFAPRRGVSAASAASAERPSGDAVPRRQGAAGEAAAGRRPAGGHLGPDVHHPQSPAGRLRPSQRNSADAHSGQAQTYSKTF